MAVELEKEHRWLQRMEGEWTWEMEADGGPGEPRIHESGKELVRSLDGVWMMCESQGRTPDGGESTSIMTLGYDPAKGRFVGTFISSMMTHMWVYDGELDAEGRVLSLYAEGPSYTDEGQTARYRDTIELRGNDERVHTASQQNADGSWYHFMSVTYRRTQMVVVREFWNDIDAHFAKVNLDATGFHYVMAPGTGGLRMPAPVLLMVRAEDAEEVQEILAELEHGSPARDEPSAS